MSESIYPSSREVRAWAIARRPDLVTESGRLPSYVIKAWDKAHPDRPYVVSQGWHGTHAGYANKGCHCDACQEAGRVYANNLYASRSDERTDDLADEFGGSR